MKNIIEIEQHRYNSTDDILINGRAREKFPRKRLTSKTEYSLFLSDMEN